MTGKYFFTYKAMVIVRSWAYIITAWCLLQMLFADINHELIDPLVAEAEYRLQGKIEKIVLQYVDQQRKQPMGVIHYRYTIDSKYNKGSIFLEYQTAQELFPKLVINLTPNYQLSTTLIGISGTIPLERCADYTLLFSVVLEDGKIVQVRSKPVFFALNYDEEKACGHEPLETLPIIHTLANIRKIHSEDSESSHAILEYFWITGSIIASFISILIGITILIKRISSRNWNMEL